MLTKDNQNLFSGQSIYVGIDYHKRSWKVTILGEHHEHKTMSQDPDPMILASYLRKNFPGASYKAVYEAGFSGFDSCRRLRNLGVDCQVIHPADVPSNEKERLQKTDKADSRKLARSLRNVELRGIDIPPAWLEADRALLRQRQRLVKDISRIKNRIKSLLMQFSIPVGEKFTDAESRHWSRKYLEWLKGLTVEELTLKHVINNYVRAGELLREQLLEVNRQVKALSRSENYWKNFQLINSIPGFGLVAAMTMLVQIGDINRFKTSDELCNYIGLVPSMSSSGDRIHMGKLIHRGRKELKIILIEASWVAIRHDPALMAKFNDLVKSMPKNKAIIRIARKLLNRIRFVLKNQQPYELGVIE